MNRIDPITEEIIRCGLSTIANEMCNTMIRTATTPTFSESHDFSTSIFDGSGRMVALADALPIHMGACKFSVEAVLEKFRGDMHPGDIYVLNDPYHGGSHIPDWTMMTPVFYEGEPVFFPVTRAHQGDTGGTIPGGYYPGATDIWQEGVRLPPIRIAEKGVLKNDIIYMLEINQREPTFLGDIKAMMGSIKVAERRLLEMLEKYGKKTVTECMDYIISYTEKRFRAEISSWPDGEYTGESFLEHDCQGVRDIAVRVKVTVRGDSMKIDFTGSDPQTPGFINSSVPNSYSYVFITLSSMIDDSIPRNEGLLNPVEIVLPRGTVVNPNPPAPCTSCTMHLGGEVGQAVAVALQKAIPEKAYIQNLKLGTPVVTYGVNPETNEFYVDQNVVMAAGWNSAAYGTDGWGSLACYFGAMTQSTTELHGMIYPIEALTRELVTDSGGPGKWRGGLGAHILMRSRAPYFASVMVIGTKYPVPGVNGGMDGSPNKVVFRLGQPNEQEVDTMVWGFPVSNGETYLYETGGGGGWGDPLERDPAAVLDDVLDEYVSIEAAGNHYGVVIDGKAMRIDPEGTEKLRGEIRKKREEEKQTKKDVSVSYLSPEWQRLCQDAVNSDAEFGKLAGDMTIDLNNVIEKCPDGKMRFLFWRFKGGKLIETIVGEAGEMDNLKPSFTTVATYDTFWKINTAKMSVESAVMNGLLTFEGDLVGMMGFADALNRFTEVRRQIPTTY